MRIDVVIIVWIDINFFLKVFEILSISTEMHICILSDQQKLFVVIYLFKIYGDGQNISRIKIIVVFLGFDKSYW